MLLSVSDTNGKQMLDGSRDFKFVPSETADYTIYVDLNTMMMSVREQEEPVRLPATLYATGSALGDNTVALPLFGNAEYKATLQLTPGNIILQDTPEATAETTELPPKSFVSNFWGAVHFLTHPLVSINMLPVY